MKDYRLFSRPMRGTLICFDASNINHKTTKNTGYKQYGVAVLVKPIVLEACLKTLKKLEIGFKSSRKVINLCYNTIYLKN